MVPPALAGARFLAAACCHGHDLVRTSSVLSLLFRVANAAKPRRPGGLQVSLLTTRNLNWEQPFGRVAWFISGPEHLSNTLVGDRRRLSSASLDRVIEQLWVHGRLRTAELLVLWEKAVKRALVAECMGCAASMHSNSFFLSLLMVGEFGDGSILAWF